MQGVYFSAWCCKHIFFFFQNSVALPSKYIEGASWAEPSKLLVSKAGWQNLAAFRRAQKWQ